MLLACGPDCRAKYSLRPKRSIAQSTCCFGRAEASAGLPFELNLAVTAQAKRQARSCRSPLPGFRARRRASLRLPRSRPWRSGGGRGRHAPADTTVADIDCPGRGYQPMPLGGRRRDDPVPLMCRECGKAFVARRLRFCSPECATAFSSAIHQTIDAGHPEGSKPPTRLDAAGARRSSGGRGTPRSGAI
jgi:hypothetical protein